MSDNPEHVVFLRDMASDLEGTEEEERLNAAADEIERLWEFAIDLSAWIWEEFENDEDRPKLTPLLERAESMNLFLSDKADRALAETTDEEGTG